jgi:subtilisin family serine protease
MEEMFMRWSRLLKHAAKRRCAVIAALIIIVGTASFAWCGRIDPELLLTLTSAGPADEFAVIVKLADTADLQQLQASFSKEEKRTVRHARVVRTLRDKATASGKDIKRLMAIREREGKIHGRRDLWIINGYALSAHSETVRELAARGDVAEVVEDRIISLGFMASGTGSGSGSWNLDMIGAPILWRMGYTGQGVVVAAIDSGVDIRHPALLSTWRGGPNGGPNDWHDSVTTDSQTSLPFDVLGHGTHVMGVMVAGNDQNGVPIGVAPGAKWIAAKISDNAGNTQISWIHDAFQWAINPDGDTLTADAPNVVNCSWDIDTAGHYNPNADILQDIQALTTAGIAVVFAGGNSGPNAGTSVSPANYPGAFSVGATDDNDLVTAISSRGPSAYDGSMFPAVTAPGGAIRTTDLTGLSNLDTYLYADGTSLAAPHVAGAFALLLSMNPKLSLAEMENAVKAAALDLGPAGPDNSYGSGRLDILQAAKNLNLIPAHTPSGDVDGDGSVTISDALLVLRAAVGLMPWSATLMNNGDVAPLVNGVPVPDRKIDISDALLILRKVVGLSFY